MRVGRLTLRWWHISLLGAGLALLGAGALLWVISWFFDDTSGFEFVEGTYVSGAPGLTNMKDPGQRDYVYEQANKYFLRSGLDYRNARDLKIAYANHGGTVLSFTLREADLDKLLANKKRLATSAVGETGDWFHQEPPFTKLKWWPPSPTEAARMSVYEDSIILDKDGAHYGAPYRILVDRPNRLVYIVGP